MTARLLGRFEPDTPAWHEARRWHVGGSDIGQIMGWSPYGSRADLLASKLSDPVPQEPTPAQLRGTILEPAALAWGTARYGYAYDEEASSATWLHPVFDFASYNPDGITTDGLLIEAKTTVDRCEDRGWGRAGTDQIPLTYRAQVTYGMEVLGLSEAHVLVLDGAHSGRPSLAFSRYIVRRDRQLGNRLLAAGLAFHRELTAARYEAAEKELS